MVQYIDELLGYTMSRWYRHGERNNFYKRMNVFQRYQYWSGVEPDAHVTFLNLSQGDTLRKIEVSHGIDGSMFLKIVLRPRAQQKIIDVINRWRHAPDNRQSIKHYVRSKRWGSPSGGLEELEYQFEFAATADFMRWTQNLNQFNEACQSVVFSCDIIQELTTIAEFSSRLQKKIPFPKNYKHIIPALPAPTSRPLRHTRLIALLYDYLGKGDLEPDDLDQVKIYLSQGDDPNEIDPMTQFRALEITGDNRVFKLLLIYHADPISPDHTSEAFSVFDQAYLENDLGKLKLIEMAVSFIDRQLPLKIKELQTSQNGTSVVTTMACYDANDPKKTVTKTLSTTLKTALEPHEEAAIIEMSLQSYGMQNDPDRVALIADLKRELHRKNQVYEIIRSGNEFIGYIFFGLIPSDEVAKFYWYCNTALIHPDYRNTGILPFLLFRQAYALLDRYEAVIVIAMLVLDLNSYRLVKNTLHWPMYQPDYMAKEIRFLLNAIGIHLDTQYTHRVLNCLVTGQMRVIEAVKAKESLIQSFFYQDILNSKNVEDSEYKGAPVTYPITVDTHKKFKVHCNKLGINLADHTAVLAPLIEPFFEHATSLNSLRKPSLRQSYLETGALFWFNKRVASNKVDPMPLPQHKFRSKL
jgi:hypothetical protein